MPYMKQMRNEHFLVYIYIGLVSTEALGRKAKESAM